MFPIRDSVSRTHEPVVVWTIIGINALVFLYQVGLSGAQSNAFVYQHGLVPLRYFSPAWGWQTGLPPTDLSPFLTNIFMHGGWLHIILNMWTLYIFGPALEDRLGRVRFAALYLLAGLAASVTHALLNASSALPVVGASGAIAGVIGAYALRFPYAWIRILVPILIIPLFFSIPAVVFAALWFFVQVMQGTSALFSPLDGGGGIAWWAHIGGFVAGWVLLGILDHSRDPGSGRRQWYNGGPWEHSRRR